MHALRGDRICAVFLTSGELGLAHLEPEHARRIREAEAADASAVLGLAEAVFLRHRDLQLDSDLEGVSASLRKVLLRETPHTIYLPHFAENHPDHAAVLPATRRALVGTDLTPCLWGFEVWSPIAHHDVAWDTTSVMADKMDAVRCYQSQLATFAYDRAVEGLNRYRGALAAGSEYAEVFQHYELGAME